MALSHYQRTLLMTIYGTHDQVKGIPPDQWTDKSVWDPATDTYSLFGHYLRLSGYDVSAMSHIKHMVSAAPLVSAINQMMDLIIDPCIWDAYAMIEGHDPMFTQPDPKDRALAVLQRIEDAFPRDKHALPFGETVHDGPDHLPLANLNRTSSHVPHAHKI